MNSTTLHAFAKPTLTVACFLLITLAIGLSQLIAQEQASEKHPLPSMEEQIKYRDEIREKFTDSMAPNMNPDHRDPAELLIKEGRRAEDNPARQYALFREGLRIAIADCDPENVTFAIDKLDEYFQIDYWEFVIDTTESMRKVAKNDQQKLSTRKLVDAFSNQAISGEQFEVAKTLIGRSIVLSSALRDDVGKEHRTQLKKDVVAMQSLVEGASRATETLETTPDDPNANQAMGNYHVFVKSEFEKGVSFWLKSDSVKYRKLAELETNLDDTNPEEIFDLAEAWFDLGDRTSGVRETRLKRRSYFWFKKCESDLRGTKAENAKEKINSLIAFLDEDSADDEYFGGIASTVNGPVTFHPDAQPAIAASLKWIVAHQLPDGGWSFNHTLGPGNFRKTTGAGQADKARSGATAMALLPLIRAGNSHKSGIHKDAVAAGLNFLAKQAKKSGRGITYVDSEGTMYSHALVTRVFCELYAKTKDRKFAGFAQGTVWFIEDAQDPIGGGWRYRPREPGDTSVFGWQMAALKAASVSDLKINPKTFALASKFLGSVASADGTSFGYISKPTRNVVDARTAIGNLGRVQLGIDKSDAKVQSAIQQILDKGPGAVGKEAYFQYYATQLMRIQGGEDWEQWRGKTHKLLIDAQSKTPFEAGSWWVKARDHTSVKGGRLSTTVFATLTLME